MATLAPPTKADPVVQDGRVDVLDQIVEPEKAIAIWRRPVPTELMQALAGIDLSAFGGVRVMFDLPLDANALAGELADAGLPQQAAFLLATDIAALAGHIARITQAHRAKVRLDVIETDACRKLHADFVTYRLLTTYCGQGTQWAHADAPERIEQLGTGDVAIMKGRLLLDDAPILHRSPPIGGTGEQRLLMVIDPINEED